MYTLIVLSAEADVDSLERAARTTLVCRCEEGIIHIPAGEYEQWLTRLIPAVIHAELKPVVCYHRSDVHAEQSVLKFVADVSRIARTLGAVSPDVRTYSANFDTRRL